MVRNVPTLMQRELSVYFYSPIAYVVLTLFLLVSGLIFGIGVFEPGNDASLEFMFGRLMPLVLLLSLSFLTMRLLSEELSSGTIETLMTSPVTDLDVVLGKFFGTFVFYLVMLTTTLLYAVLIAIYGPLDWGETFATYFGLALLGALYISVGLFFSACTRNQVVAVICTMLVLIIFTYVADLLAQQLEGTGRIVMQHLSIVSHFQDFARGLVDVNHLVFFLTTTGMFLFLAVKVMESRRWR